MGKKITIADVLAQKGLKKTLNVYHSELFDRDFETEKIAPEKIVNIMKNSDSEYERYQELIYNACPFFRAKDLQTELNIENPIDVVGAVFNDNYAEIFEFGNQILARYGFTADRVEQTKKQ